MLHHNRKLLGNRVFLFAFFFLFFLPLAFSLELPIGLQKINEYNQAQAEFFSDNLSFLVAFVGGILSFLLPCTIAILPAYFAYTFETKKELTKKTFLFFLGFSLVFITLGVIAGLLKKGLDEIRVNYSYITIIAGFLLLFFGLRTFMGKGIPLITIKRKPNPSNAGIFFYGILMSVGWFACLGPILSGILLIGGLLGSIAKSALLLFFYSLGIFVPFFLISIFYDKYNLGESRIIRGKEFSLGRNIHIHSTNLISGALLIFLGLIFIFYRGTSIVNKTLAYTTTPIYDLQRLLAGNAYVSWIGGVVLVLLIYLIFRVIRGSKKTP